MSKLSKGTASIITIRTRVREAISVLRSIKQLVKYFPKEERKLYDEYINRQLNLLRKHTKSI
jgi:hypothetical protein